MEMKLPEKITDILRRLEKGGFEAFVAGGAVRDMIMGREPHDYDIATSARPDQIKQLFDRTIDTGIKHGTVTVVENGIGYEVTTFRKDGEYHDGRHPKNVHFVNDIFEDCKRRDFTINAMMYNPNGCLKDYFGGVEDIKRKQIKCVGDVHIRFMEDALRMMRAVRFSAILGFDIESETADAIKKCAPLITNVSGERILAELNKILLSSNPYAVSKLHELGLLKYIIPQLEKCFGEPQKNKYHIYDVGEHIMQTVKNTKCDLVLRWAALLHDVGKPSVSSVDSDGIIHFYGHHRVSCTMAEDILYKLHMDKDTIKKIIVLIENHDVRVDTAAPAVKRMMARTGEKLFLKLMDLQIADNAAKNPEYFPEKKRRIEILKEIYKEILSAGEPYRISDLVVNGRDLMRLGYKPGRIISDTLKALLDEVIINPYLNERDYLIHRAIEMKNMKR